VSGTLMVNRKTFYEYFCPGQSWCVNQLKNPHDLSLWWPPILQRIDESAQRTTARRALSSDSLYVAHAFATRALSATRDRPMHRFSSRENVTPKILQVCAKSKTSSASKWAVSPTWAVNFFWRPN